MKTRFIILYAAITSVTLFITPQLLFAQVPTQHHFFIHGFSSPLGAGASMMDGVSSDMTTRFSWTLAAIPVLPDYSGILTPASDGIAWVDNYPSTGGLAGVHVQLLTYSGDYVGLGYSLGGLFARYEAQEYGSTFISGLVTLHTPNNGVWIGDFAHRSTFVAQWIKGQAGMLYANTSFLGEIWAGIANALNFIGQWIGEAVNNFATTVDGGVSQDCAPGSGLLNSINGTQPTGVLRVAVWGETVSPYYAFFPSDAYGASWNAARCYAWETANVWTNAANSIHPHWWCSGLYSIRDMCRAAADNWITVYNSMNDIESAWEVATAGLGQQSDGLVGVASQQAIPSPSFSPIQDNSGIDVNHGAAVYDDDPTIRANIYLALLDAGAH
jgi:hypothetical protein